jgi:hypothetical protein
MELEARGGAGPLARRRLQMERADGGSLCHGPWRTGNITRESRIGVSGGRSRGEDTGGYPTERSEQSSTFAGRCEVQGQGHP